MNPTRNQFSLNRGASRKQIPISRFSAFNKSRGASETPWYLRTHPLDEKRIAALKAELPAARKQFKPQ